MSSETRVRAFETKRKLEILNPQTVCCTFLCTEKKEEKEKKEVSLPAS